uniref:Transposase Helix-turn-helix domain-containing protein n=1 Tax=Rhodnius prolixus TaxID=13249 RepID=T1ID06_RHOPR
MSLEATIRYFLLQRNNAIESSTSSSDEEWDTILQNCISEKRKIRPRIINYQSVIDRYSDEEFKSHFRLSRNTFNYLHELIQEDLVRRVPGCPTIPSHQQLMIALWKMATTDSYRSVCDRLT